MEAVAEYNKLIDVKGVMALPYAYFVLFKYTE